MTACQKKKKKRPFEFPRGSVCKHKTAFIQTNLLFFMFLFSPRTFCLLLPFVPHKQRETLSRDANCASWCFHKLSQDKEPSVVVLKIFRVINILECLRDGFHHTNKSVAQASQNHANLLIQNSVEGKFCFRDLHRSSALRHLPAVSPKTKASNLLLVLPHVQQMPPPSGLSPANKIK